MEESLPKPRNGSSTVPKFVTALGILCVTVGILWDFSESIVGNRFGFLIDYNGEFLVTLLVGILLSAGGAIAWARHLSRDKKFRVAGLIFVFGLVVFPFVPNNVHGPGMLLGFCVICAWALSLILAVTAAASRDSPGSS
jgi:hypothetical protein